MSADNAILVLKLKDQIRVIEAFAIDNLWWSWVDTLRSGELVSARVFEYFKKSKKFKDKEESFSIASKMYEKSEIVEYGIVPLKINKTWLELLECAREDLNKEKTFILNNPTLKNRAEILEEINYAYSDVLKEINREKYAKQ